MLQVGSRGHGTILLTMMSTEKSPPATNSEHTAYPPPHPSPPRGEGAGCCKRLGPHRHKGHRSFSVDSPASASTTAMIQNRITICGSVQPFCSK
jgi:hypothetical protein